jgi:hypothetical protein
MDNPQTGNWEFTVRYFTVLPSIWLLYIFPDEFYVSQKLQTSQNNSMNIPRLFLLNIPHSVQA